MIPKLTAYEQPEAIESTLSGRVAARLAGIPQFGYPMGPEFLHRQAMENAYRHNLEIMKMNKEIMDTSIAGATNEILDF